MALAGFKHIDRNDPATAHSARLILSREPDVEQKQIDNLKTAIRLARRTAGYPEGSRFKWNVEVIWPVEGYLPGYLAERVEEG